MRIGIIGAGQLGQMLGFAAKNLDVECRFIDPSENPPAAQCGDVVAAQFDDPAALADLARWSDVVTYEFENVPLAALQHIGDNAPVYPPASALKHSQDRLLEKQLFESLDVPLPGYHTIDSRADMDKAAARLGLPLVIKTRRFGYDGKGQFVARVLSDLDAAWTELSGQALIAEQWIDFDYEVSCIGVRSVCGETAIYPLAKNVHRNGILHTSVSPIERDSVTSTANGYVQRLLEHLDYVGVLALELFVIDGQLLANEFAPRVHNSGHWTIEASETSQFENHLRAVLDLPLGATDSRGHAGMVNLIGEITSATRNLNVGVLHDYGKLARPGRKLGHTTVVANSALERDRLVEKIDKIVTESTHRSATTA